MTLHKMKNFYLRKDKSNIIKAKLVCDGTYWVKLLDSNNNLCILPINLKILKTIRVRVKSVGKRRLRIFQKYTSPKIEVS